MKRARESEEGLETAGGPRKRPVAAINPAAARLQASLSKMLGTDAWTLQLWDGTEVTPPHGPEHFRVTVHTREALDSMLGALPERAFGRAYADSMIDIEPLEAFLQAGTSVTTRQKALAVPGLLRAALALGARPRREVLDGIEARLPGWRHTRERDAAAVRHHYDVPEEFYRLWLDETLTYSCAYFEDAGVDIDTAQQAKLELVCRKLRLQPGETLLDIGCGWGSLPLHAARHHGARVVGITLSPAQAKIARERAQEQGLADQVEIRLADYRDPVGQQFDAVASIGMVEHVGRARLKSYAHAVHRALRPGGRALIHGVTAQPGDGVQRGSLVDAFIFPDTELHPAGQLSNELEATGLELRDAESLREHYALTLHHWAIRLRAHRDAAERIVGLPRLRLWELYLSAAELNFHTGRTAIHQLLLVKREASGASGMPLTRADWYR